MVNPSKSEQQGFITLLAAVFILAGLGAGLLMLSQTQIFKSKAADNTTFTSQPPSSAPIAKPTLPHTLPTLAIRPSPSLTLGSGETIATPSPALNFTCTACKADINSDGIVNYKDYSNVSGCMDKNANSLDFYNQPCNAADIDSDSRVGWPDFLCVQSMYTQKCNP